MMKFKYKKKKKEKKHFCKAWILACILIAEETELSWHLVLCVVFEDYITIWKDNMF